MSTKCEERLRIALYVADLIMGVGLIIIGAYRLGTFEIDEPHTFLLALYYIIFGGLLILFLVFRQKIYFCFHLLSIPLDITDIGRFIICLLLIFGAVLNAIYFLLFYVSDPAKEAKKPKLEEPQGNKPLKKDPPAATFGKRDLEPEVIQRDSEVKRDSTSLQRRT